MNALSEHHELLASRGKPPLVDRDASEHRFSLAPLALGGLEKSTPRLLLRQVRRNWRQLEAVNPDFFVGATVFGSSVKGRMHTASDIDVALFVDPDAANGAISDADAEIMQAFLALPDPSETAADQNASDCVVAAPILIAANERIVRAEAARFATDRAARENLLGFTTPGVMMFTLSLGSNPEKRGATLTTLRGAYLDELERHGEDGEATYRYLMERVYRIEDFFSRAPSRLPKSINDARRYWHIPEQAAHSQAA